MFYSLLHHIKCHLSKTIPSLKGVLLHTFLCLLLLCCPAPPGSAGQGRLARSACIASCCRFLSIGVRGCLQCCLCWGFRLWSCVLFWLCILCDCIQRWSRCAALPAAALWCRNIFLCMRVPLLPQLPEVCIP